MSIRVESEIGRLKRVLVHRPGDEIVRMTQHDLELSLFDDILSPAETQREHDTMVGIIRAAGAETLDIQNMLEAALKNAPPAEREDLLQRLCETAGAPTLAQALDEWEPKRLATALISGIYWTEVPSAETSLGRLRDFEAVPPRMALRPVPNLMFMRDPGISVYDGFVVGRMATHARVREPMLVAFAVQHSGMVNGGARLLFQADDSHRHTSFRALEGGDVLVLSSEVLMVGCSERTSASTIERLAQESLFATYPKLQRVYAVMMPEARSVMHLDTILTQVDRKLFLGHRPLIAGQTGRDPCAVARLERDKPATLVEGACVLDVLREELGADTQLVACGGNDALHQEREQWTDGANAVALAPGKIILYARNVFTIAALREHGFEEARIHAAQPAEQTQQLIADGMAAAQTVFSFSGSELSRARGGGRCLTMPIEREPL
jgi:arginine deiminase